MISMKFEYTFMGFNVNILSIFLKEKNRKYDGINTTLSHLALRSWSNKHMSIYCIKHI